jgi:hypothetical protein
MTASERPSPNRPRQLWRPIATGVWLWGRWESWIQRSDRVKRYPWPLLFLLLILVANGPLALQLIYHRHDLDRLQLILTHNPNQYLFCLAVAGVRDLPMVCLPAASRVGVGSG